MNNPDTEEKKENNPEESSGILFNGSWENKNRDITAAAFTGLIGIGAIYFNLQSVLVTVFVMIYKAAYKIELYGSFLERLNDATLKMKTPILTALIISQFFFMLFPALWIVKKWHTKDVVKYIRLQLCPVKEILLAVVITISMLPLCYYLSNLLLQIFEVPEIIRNLGSQLFTAKSGAELIILIIVIAVTPAICEEIFFRGYVQRTLERTLGLKSFILTGILFGLFHMQPLSLLSLSLLGILFSFFYYRSKSILPSSAAHFTNNLIAVLLLYSQSQFLHFADNIPLIFVTGSLLISSVLIIFYLRVTKDIGNKPLIN